MEAQDVELLQMFELLDLPALFVLICVAVASIGREEQEASEY